MTSKQFIAALAILIVIITAWFRDHVQSAYTQVSDARTALMNPKHMLWSQQSPDVFKVRFETSKGSFVIEAHREWAPRGADRFYNLVRAGFFDDSRLFRVRAGYIAQFGIPGTPDIAAIWKDQAIPDDPVRQSNTRGFIGYAMTGPNTL